MNVGDLIVFYGSLRPPFETQCNLGIDRMVEHVGTARFRGTLHDLGSYPALVGGEVVVVGDLYRAVDERLGGILDPFEGYDPADPDGSYYVREWIDLIEPAGRAWVYRYLGTPPEGSLVNGGDWVAYLTARGRDGTLGPSGGP